MNENCNNRLKIHISSSIASHISSLQSSRPTKDFVFQFLDREKKENAIKLLMEETAHAIEKNVYIKSLVQFVSSWPSF